MGLGTADRRSWRQLPLLLALFLAAVVGVLQSGTFAPAALYVEAPASVTAPTLPGTPLAAPALPGPALATGAETASDAVTERPAVQSPAGAREIDPREIPATLPAGPGADRALSDQDIHFTRTPRGPPLHLV